MIGKKIKLSVIGLIMTVFMAGVPALAAADINHNNDNDNGNSNAHNKVTLCHATGSQSNPYVEITVDANGAVSGHAGHANDIIPPFTYNDHGTNKSFPGLNWDTQGQAILNNNCVPVSGQGGQGGQGGGGQVTNNTNTNNTNTNTQSTNITTSTPAPGGQGGGAGQASVSAPQVQTAPQGGVAAGEGGGAKAYQPAAVMGLLGALGSVVSGASLLKRL
ncbi:MAG TPA: hypothetical protein VMU97_01910 [Candidatus Dormibacteraeota bacterium]|nr:hypothetical protein [Candidatus Dormibacteraeota bacterium]